MALPFESTGISGVFVNTRFLPDPPYRLLWLENEINFGQGCVVGKKMDLEKIRTHFSIIVFCVKMSSGRRDLSQIPLVLLESLSVNEGTGTQDVACDTYGWLVILSVARREN